MGETNSRKVGMLVEKGKERDSPDLLKASGLGRRNSTE